VIPSLGKPFGMIQIEGISHWSQKCHGGFQAINKTISTISDESPRITQRQVAPEHIRPPKIFKDAIHMIVALWKMTYPKFKFPLELIIIFLLRKHLWLPPAYVVFFWLMVGKPCVLVRANLALGRRSFSLSRLLLSFIAPLPPLNTIADSPSQLIVYIDAAYTPTNYVNIAPPLAIQLLSFRQSVRRWKHDTFRGRQTKMWSATPGKNQNNREETSLILKMKVLVFVQHLPRRTVF
jgi:hypothetical protein